MGVIRVNKTKNYTVLSNYHFKEKNMSLKAKGLLSLMLSLPDSWNYTIAGLVSLSKDGKDSVMSGLSELEKFGYLIRTQKTNDKGQFSGVEYHIYEQPQEVNPLAEKQTSDNQKADKLNAEDPPQLNTNNIKYSFNKIIYNINNYIDVLNTIPDSQLRNLFCDFLDNRNRMGDPMTVRGFELLVERVRELGGLSIQKQTELVRTAVINNWKNVYAPGEQEVDNEDLKKLKDFYF
jgi:hypothetical protein